MFKFFIYFTLIVSLSFLITGFAFCSPKTDSTKTGLLFYLSGENGFNADYSIGDGKPNFLYQVKIIDDGAKGKGLQCGDHQLLAYRAPGNIYAERGTLSFFWRAREPLGKTPFAIFRVGYADHSSWDMQWLRIDYNGNGFDAFVTDINLARIRVSYMINKLPDPKDWIHLALSWDETSGIKFYVNGELAAKKDTSDVFYAGLDQFGTHSRIISPYQVQSAYNYVRGGDVDEITIYDHQLTDPEVLELFKYKNPVSSVEFKRNLADQKWRNEWKLRYGWNREGDDPPYLIDKETSVRKVEINDAYDLKRWYWKSNDGIRETTWPGVYNRSRILGRSDYFIIPDWDCYSLSGKSIRYNMPDEPWNYLEITGAAFGTIAVSPNKEGSDGSVIFTRPKYQERTFHKLKQEITGKTIVFTNEVQETPIGEFDVFDIKPGKEPKSNMVLEYRLSTVDITKDFNLSDIISYINGRFTKDERNIMLALPSNSPVHTEKSKSHSNLPIVQVLIPSDFRYLNSRRASYTWANSSTGLDGIAIDIPAVNLKPNDNGFISMNIQVKDPIWPLRNMFDFSFSVKPNEARTLWLDLRDRILPNDRPLFLTIACSSPDFSHETIEGAKIRLIFKTYDEAKKEHINDKFLQVKDNYGMIIEEYPNTMKLNKFVQFYNDVSDLLRVEPNHYPGQNYWYFVNQEQAKPKVSIPACPNGVPAWAFYQVEDLKELKNFVEWYIDNRQIQDGEFGGGLSDDGDLTNYWPGLAMMGCDPTKIKNSLQKELEAMYNNGMFTDGLPTIQTDGLHTYEEGINVQAQVMPVDFGDPKLVERMMETVRGLEEKIIGKNKAGHYHFRSSFWGANKISEEGVWEWSVPFEYLILQPAMYLGEYFGNSNARKLVINMADGLLAHSRKDKNGKIILDTEINFRTDESRHSRGLENAMQDALDGRRDVPQTASAIYPLWASWKWTSDPKYLQPILDLGPDVMANINSNMMDLLNKRNDWGSEILGSTTPDSKSEIMRHFAWQVSGNKEYLVNYYKDQIENSEIFYYQNTEGSMWIDRVYAAGRELQRSRLGGVAHARNATFPGNPVTWKFKKPADAMSVGILVNYAIQSEIKMEVYNLEKFDVNAEIIGGNVLPGTWEIMQGVDTNEDGKADTEISNNKIKFERSSSIPVKFPSGKTTIINLHLADKSLDYNKRPDLAIGNDDIKIEGSKINVTVHNIGAVDSPQSSIVLETVDGKKISESQIPELKAPNDLIPKTKELTLTIPDGIDLKNLKLQIDPENKLIEITKVNNEVGLKRIN